MAIGVLQGRVRGRVEVPLDGGEVRQPAGLHVSPHRSYGVHWLLLGKQVNRRAERRGRIRRQAGERRQIPQREVDLQRRAGSSYVVQPVPNGLRQRREVGQGERVAAGDDG